MPGDAVFAHQVDKVPLGVARQRRFAKMRVLAQIGRGFNIHVGKVAAAAAGHQNFTPGFLPLSSSSTRSRLPACAAQNIPAAPAPITMASNLSTPFLVPNCRDCKYFTLVTPAEKSRLDTSLKDIGLSQQGKT
jgi:hypothetical protein